MWELQTPYFPSHPLHNLTCDAYHTHAHTTRGVLLKQPHKNVTHTMRWGFFFFLQGILWQRKGIVRVLIFMMCLLLCELRLWVREIKWARTKQAHTNPFLYSVWLLFFKVFLPYWGGGWRGVNSTQSVTPGWRDFLSTLKPCRNQTGQYQDVTIVLGKFLIWGILDCSIRSKNVFT